MINSLISFFLLILVNSILTSCSLTPKGLGLNQAELKDDIKLKLTNEEPLWCSEPSNKQFIGKSKTNNQIILNFLEKEKRYNFTFIEKAVITHLLELLSSPSFSSPMSKLDFIHVKNKKITYLSYSSKEEGNNYIAGLEDILRRYKTKRNLYDLAHLIDTDFKDSFIVDENLEHFLASNKELILKDENLRHYYFRGEDILKEGETLPKIKLYAFLKRLDKIKTKARDYLYSFYDKNKVEFKCNYDMDQYKNSLFYIFPYNIQSNIFGLHEGDEYFISSSSIKSNLKSMEQSFFLRGSSDIGSSAICISNNYGIISNNSRDPGQHLYHLLEYDLSSSQTNEDLNSIISFSRHIFLTNPLRLIYESNRGSEEQLSDLLELNIPLYNSDYLGEIWGWFKKDKKFYFHLDERREGSISCMK